MITTASIVYPMMAGGLPYHPIYIFLAIGYGSLFVSWMNDGGFWVVSKLGGLTEKQTLASWTVLTAVISVAGLAATWGLSLLLPCVQR
jgi:GntP family gluconate:H+ symporter